MLKKYLLGLATGLVSASSLYAQVTIKPEVKKAMEQVKADEIKADITYLADDKLKGRMPGTEGYQTAVDYVIGRLKGLNVKPAGENGTWLQTVRLRKATAHNIVFTIDSAGQIKTLTGGYAVLPNPVMPAAELSSGMVFAGYGISEPALGYDDYQGLDVKGKTVVIVRGSPEKFPSSTSAHVANSATLLRKAAEHGAIGVIVASLDTTVRRNGPGFSRPVYSVMNDKGGVAVSDTYHDGIKCYATVQYRILKSFFDAAGRNIRATVAQMKAGQPQSFQISQHIDITYGSNYQDITSYNVVGKIEGSDPKLKKEYVVHSAHLDHVGVGRPVEGDSIYNGAHDNASGVASLLGIAKIYNNMKVKPKRSVLVVMLTGEEMGDLGSGYFAGHPTVPVTSIVADVNTDMPTIIAPLLSVTALGAEHSSLSKQVDEAATYLGLSVEPDPEPKEARFTRSDQYSFVVHGIPALHIKYGNKTADGKNNLSEFVAKWRAKYYHKPQDDINGIFDFDAGVKYAQLNFLIGYLVAQEPQRPTWNQGDIFASR